jgi:hypothetical protein
MVKGALGQRLLQAAQLLVELVDRVTDPEPEIQRDLIVTGAGGVQATGVGADDFGQPRLDIHMNVLERAREGEGPGLDFAADLL